jgi:hypothetical protein
MEVVNVRLKRERAELANGDLENCSLVARDSHQVRFYSLSFQQKGVSLKLKTENWRLRIVSLVRRVRCAHVHVAQIAQHGLVFFAHAAREVQIIQMLVPGRLRHIL